MPDDFQGALVRWYKGYASQVEWIGFPDEDLHRQINSDLWFTEIRSHNMVETHRVERWCDLAYATVTEAKMFPLEGEESEASEILVSLPFEWGDQPAAHFIVLKNGKIIADEKGCGERTPIPCLKDGHYTFTDDATLKFEEWQELEDAWRQALENGKSFDGGNLLPHLKSCYHNGMNPLPTCRKKFGGTWEYRGPEQRDSIKESEWPVMFDVAENTVVLHRP